ncbi:MAG TPA: glycosyltransferase family 2 protein [Candidatus Cybelea sp.]|nr:glycosyltransferase family 2 protein [Candidatus Cybelea sp.]
MGEPALSFAIPCHNELSNLPGLLQQLTAEADKLGRDYEIVIVDDCSTDGSWELLKQLAAQYPRLRALRLSRNSGESAASFTAMRAARGGVIVTLDADLQNDPRDLPRFLAALDGADCVCGTRVDSRGQGDNVLKLVTSRISNAIRGWVLGDTVSDAGCTYRAFRRETITDLPFFKGIHRFLPILVAFRGYKLAEVAVTNRPRTGGRSHYGLFDRAGAVIDMFAVRWLKSRMISFHVAERYPPE